MDYDLFADRRGATASVVKRSSVASAKHVGILLVDGFPLSAVAAVVEVLLSANDVRSISGVIERTYDVRFMSASGGCIACSSSCRIGTESIRGTVCARLDAFFIISGEGQGISVYDEDILKKLRDARARDGHRFVGDGRIIMLSAAGLPGRAWPVGSDTIMDAAERSPLSTRAGSDRYDALVSALMLVESDFGPNVAQAVRTRLMPGEVHGITTGQSDASLLTIRERIRASARWIEENCARTISMSDAAAVSAMSERNFLRRFKQEMGVAPLEYLTVTRLNLSCHLLTETELPVDKIARRAGVGSGARLAKLFRKRLSVSPTEYRADHRARAAKM